MTQKNLLAWYFGSKLFIQGREALGIVSETTLSHKRGREDDADDVTSRHQIPNTQVEPSPDEEDFSMPINSQSDQSDTNIKQQNSDNEEEPNSVPLQTNSQISGTSSREQSQRIESGQYESWRLEPTQADWSHPHLTESQEAEMDRLSELRRRNEDAEREEIKKYLQNLDDSISSLKTVLEWYKTNVAGKMKDLNYKFTEFDVKVKSAIQSKLQDIRF